MQKINHSGKKEMADKEKKIIRNVAELLLKEKVITSKEQTLLTMILKEGNE